MHVLPKFRGYRIRPEILEDIDSRGANTNRLVQVPLGELAAWDEAHDDAGRLRRRRAQHHQHAEGEILQQRSSDSSNVAVGGSHNVVSEKGFREV